MIFFFSEFDRFATISILYQKTPKTLVHKCKQEKETCKGGIYSLQMVHA